MSQNLSSEGITSYAALKLHVLMWKEICTHALKHQELFFRKSQNKDINYEGYDTDILKICSNDFQFAKYLKDNQSDIYEKLQSKEANIYSTLFLKKEKGDSIKVLQSLATDYVEAYLNDGISFAQSRKTLFEDLGNSDNIKVSIQDILAKPTPDIINETTAQTLINRFRRIYLMRRLLFFSYLQAAMAILENDKNNQKTNTDNFYDKFSTYIAKDQDYLFLYLTDGKSKTLQAAAQEDSGINSYSDVSDVTELKRMLDGIHDTLISGGDAPKDIKDKVAELSQKTDAFKAKYIKESLSDKWKTGSFLSDKTVAKKTLNENASDVAKSLSGEIGQGFGNLLTGQSPSIKDGDFWKHVGRSVGPMIFGVLGTALGGPIGGSLLGGIGKSIFGAILGDEPDPLSEKLDQEFDDLKKNLDEKFSLVNGKLDKLSEDLHNLFTETQDKITDTDAYIENLFKDSQKFGTYYNKIHSEAMDLKKDINIVQKYYVEILFNSKAGSIPQIGVEAKDIIGMEDKILTRLDNILKKIYSDDYTLSANRVNIPNSPGNNSLIRDIIVAHATEKDRRRFNATIDYLLMPLNVVEELYRFYYQKRKFLFASQAALFVFHRHEIADIDVVPSLKAMYNAQDDINAALLLHPFLLKTNSIGQRNLEFYSLVQTCWRVANSNGLQSFGFMIDPKDRFDRDTRVFLNKPQNLPLQFGYNNLGNYALIKRDNLPDNSPFTLKLWELAQSRGEANVHICLGQDDTLTLFDGDKKLGDSIHYVNRLDLNGWTQVFPGDGTRSVGKCNRAISDKTILKFDFTVSGQYPYIEIAITKSDKFKERIEISSIVSPDDYMAQPPKKKMIKTLEFDYGKKVENKVTEDAIIYLDMRYQPGEDTIALWYSFRAYNMPDAVDIPVADNADKEIKIEVNTLLKGFPYPEF